MRNIHYSLFIPGRRDVFVLCKIQENVHIPVRRLP